MNATPHDQLPGRLPRNSSATAARRSNRLWAGIRSAISTLANPCAAERTILARTPCAYEAV